MRIPQLSRKTIERFIAGLAFGLVFTTGAAAVVAQQSFATPEEGAQALARAMKAGDERALRAIFGAEGSKLLRSGDAVADAQNREKFNNAYAEANTLQHEQDARATLVVGKDNWPLPIPLVRQDDRWHFDTRAGADEILKRRIGRNELAAMQTCQAIADAEHEYAARHLDSDGVPVYAARITSHPGARDGLYWPDHPSEAPSPLGALLAKAADEGYPQSATGSLEPYHGYYYRILTRQEGSAPGGRRDYAVKGKLLGGFAVLAYPARYAVSGIMSFMVGADGAVYAKNLGIQTHSMVASLTAFDPDASWKREEAGAR